MATKKKAAKKKPNAEDDIFIDTGKKPTADTIDLKSLSVKDLNALQERIINELSCRSGFDEEFKLNNSKAFRGATYVQFQLAEHLAKKTDSKILRTKSQIFKYMDVEDMDRAIKLMENGKKIKII